MYKLRYFFHIMFLMMFLWIYGIPATAECQGWSDEKIRLLPDDSFAVIETREKTRIRHCPYRDEEGNIDEEQLIYELGTLEKETWIDLKNKEIAKKHLEVHYNRFIASVRQKGLQESVNINTAKLTDLVALPRIGPVLAVKIAQYRKENGLFEHLEDIKKIKGIGQGTFNAIRHYIRL